ncbi:MAG: hypothetical protein IKI22_01405 [Neisseriaceae bacterium]|nr:hypothetical protein [Neisseriaceae bacterium]
MVKLKDKWRELSIEKLFLAVFILQNITLIGFAFCIEGDNFFKMLPLIFAFSLTTIHQQYKQNGKVFIGYSICILSLWLFQQNTCLTKNFNIEYNNLKSYSGNVTRPHCTGGGCIAQFYFTLKKDEDKIINFECFPSGFDGCREEIKEGSNISVKYVEFSVVKPMLPVVPLPLFMKKNIIYEVNDDDKVIYSYNYFIKKYLQHQKNVRIFATYLVIHSFVFCILYYMIHKNFIKRN